MALSGKIKMRFNTPKILQNQFKRVFNGMAPVRY